MFAFGIICEIQHSSATILTNLLTYLLKPYLNQTLILTFVVVGCAVYVCSECETGNDTISEALALSLPQTAVQLLDVQRLHDVETDLSLAWDPLLLCTDIMAELLLADHMSAGPTSHINQLLLNVMSAERQLLQGVIGNKLIKENEK